MAQGVINMRKGREGKVAVAARNGAIVRKDGVVKKPTP
jgi:hypothetical protein